MIFWILAGIPIYMIISKFMESKMIYESGQYVRYKPNETFYFQDDFKYGKINNVVVSKNNVHFIDIDGYYIKTSDWIIEILDIDEIQFNLLAFG